MKKQPYTKRPFHFTVGLGEHSRHLQILAADEHTRTWALSVQARISLLTRAITDELRGCTIVTDEAGVTVLNAPQVDIREIRRRFASSLRAAFPRSRFEVTEPPAPVPTVVTEVPAEAFLGIVGAIARVYGVAPALEAVDSQPTAVRLGRQVGMSRPRGGSL